MSRPRRKKNDPAPGWAWMLFGLFIGLAVALVVYLDAGRPDRVLPAVTAGAEPRVAEAPAEQVDEAAEIPAGAPGPGPAPLSFYTRLGESEVLVPNAERAFEEQLAAAPDIIVQAGSFPVIERADRRQASLALLGIESSVESAIVDGEFYFRVIIGPLRDRGEINRVIGRLSDEGIEHLVREAND